MAKTAAEIISENHTVMESPQTAEIASSQYGPSAEIRPEAIHCVDEETFQRSLKKVFAAHSRLLAKLAE